MSLRALDLCAGAGGLSLGFKRAGWDVTGVERDGDAWHTHLENVGPCRLADIVEWHPSQQYDAVVGGVPCQGFSMAGLRRGSDLFRHLIRCGVESGARAIMLENVEGMVSWKDKNPQSPTFELRMPDIIERAMLESGFCPEWRVINCADFGTPQIRKRIIFVAFADIAHWSWPVGSHGPRGSRPWISVREALGLGESPFRSGLKDHAKPGSPQGMRLLDVDRPAVTVGTGGNYESISALDRPSPTVKQNSNHEGRGNRTSQRPMGELQAVLERAGIYDRPRTTVDTVGVSRAGRNGRAGESQNRGEIRLGPEELAILQGFPPGFRFYGNKTSQFRQIGNAFPPQPAEALARALAEALGST